MLEYDDSAFYYFSMTLIGFYLIPGTYFWIKSVFLILFPYASLTGSNNKGKTARTKIEKEKEDKMKKNLSTKHTFFSYSFVWKTCLLFAMYSCFFYLMYSLSGDKQIATFDPYHILELETDATDKQIKKAYRQLSLKWHPDKNMGNAYAETQFLMVRKAYESLTDEIAKANWQKWGNPDGKQALEVSIGLPTFLLDKSNHQIVLLVYLVVLVVLIPTVVGLWYNKSKKYGNKMILYETYNNMNAFLNENVLLKRLPEILATSGELREVNYMDSRDGEDMKKLISKLKDDMKITLKHPPIIKGNVLIHSHLKRMHSEMSPKMAKDLYANMSRVFPLIDAMQELATSKRWLGAVINIIEFSQYMTQAVWFKDSALYQLPHFNSEIINKHIMKGKASAKNLVDYIKQDDDLKKGLEKMSEEDKKDVLDACKIFPLIDVSVNAHVDDEEEIAEGDIITVEVKVTRTNLEVGEKAQPVHAPFFPGIKEEAWWVILGQKNRNQLIAIEKVVSNEREFKADLHFMGPSQAGLYEFEVTVKCDSYLGLDKTETVSIEVIPEADLPEYKPNAEDLAIMNEPSLFESLQAGLEEDSDSDVESDAESVDDNEESDSDDSDDVEDLIAPKDSRAKKTD